MFLGETLYSQTRFATEAKVNLGLGYSSMSWLRKPLITCQTSGLVYGIACCFYPAIYIGETGRILRPCLGEHLRSMKENLPVFPVAEHFNAAGHFFTMSLFVEFWSRRASQRKQLEMYLISYSAPVIRAA